MTSSKGDFSKEFGRDAARYAARRPGYPPRLFAAIRAAGAGPDLAIDLGAGTGAASASLVHHFRRVIAVEPDSRLAALIAPPVEPLVACAEDVSFASASVDAVIAATAFHWMDQRTVIAHVRDWLRPGGVFCPFAYDLFQFTGTAHDFFEDHLARWAPYRDQRLLNAYDPAPVLRASNAFAQIDVISDTLTRTYSASDAAGLLLTASFASAYARDTIGIQAYAVELANGLAAIAPRHEVTFPIRAVMARTG